MFRNNKKRPSWATQSGGGKQSDAGKTTSTGAKRIKTSKPIYAAPRECETMVLQRSFPLTKSSTKKVDVGLEAVKEAFSENYGVPRTFTMTVRFSDIVNNVFISMTSDEYLVFCDKIIPILKTFCKGENNEVDNIEINDNISVSFVCAYDKKGAKITETTDDGVRQFIFMGPSVEKFIKTRALIRQYIEYIRLVKGDVENCMLVLPEFAVKNIQDKVTMRGKKSKASDVIANIDWRECKLQVMADYSQNLGKEKGIDSYTLYELVYEELRLLFEYKIAQGFLYANHGAPGEFELMLEDQKEDLK